jgi:peptide/nickel transport system ATP-binding protein
MPTEPFLVVRGLAKRYARRRWWTGEELGTAALRGVDLTLERGAFLGLVGPSGCGKTTLARCLARFETADSGQIRLGGKGLSATPRAAVQLIFQDAAGSLNPRFTAGEIVSEPLRIAGRHAAECRRAAEEWLPAVGLPANASAKPALAFSGGERQRLAIARALAAQPELLILDESFSGLDPKLEAQLGDLLLSWQQRLRLTAILITHDLALAARIASEIAVMENGAVVEQQPSAGLIAAPRHPRTAELVAASRALNLVP